MEFFYQFGLLFSNMQWYVAVCLVIGLALLLIEVFQPGFGMFGILGTVLLAVGTILRAIFHTPEDDVLVQVFQLIFLLAIIILIAFILFLIGNKRNWFKRSSIFTQNDTAVDTVFSDGTENFNMLKGKNGVTATDLRPVGKATIDRKTYDVVAESFFIDKGTKVEVIAVEGSKITVRNKN